MKDPEDLLRDAPRIQPRESLGRKMGALFEEARHVAEPGWFGFRIPAWVAVMACGVIVKGGEFQPGFAANTSNCTTILRCCSM